MVRSVQVGRQIFRTRPSPGAGARAPKILTSLDRHKQSERLSYHETCIEEETRKASGRTNIALLWCNGIEWGTR